MIEVKDKYKCCGCSACFNICPKKCISMVEDSEGFLYPSINIENCIECGLCEKVCPLLKTKLDEKPLIASYAVQNNNKIELRLSTSGGFFSPLARYVINNGGIVFGAAFENMELLHSGCDSYEACNKYRGSKYLQSRIGKTYTQAKSFLDKGRLVVFSGTPCQIAGLHSFLKEKNIMSGI